MLQEDIHIRKQRLKAEGEDCFVRNTMAGCWHSRVSNVCWIVSNGAEDWMVAKYNTPFKRDSSTTTKCTRISAPRAGQTQCWARPDMIKIKVLKPCSSHSPAPSHIPPSARLQWGGKKSRCPSPWLDQSFPSQLRKITRMLSLSGRVILSPQKLTELSSTDLLTYEAECVTPSQTLQGTQLFHHQQRVCLPFTLPKQALSTVERLRLCVHM